MPGSGGEWDDMRLCAVRPLADLRATRAAQGFSEESVREVDAKLYTFGSFRLGVHGPGADIDACVQRGHCRVLGPALRSPWAAGCAWRPASCGVRTFSSFSCGARRTSQTLPNWHRSWMRECAPPAAPRVPRLTALALQEHARHQVCVQRCEHRLAVCELRPVVLPLRL